MIQGFDFCWCPVVEVLVQPLLVPPGDPLEGGLFQGVHGFERVGSFDQFRLVCAVDGFCQRGIIRVAHAARAGENAGLVEARAVQAADGLGAVIRMVDQAARIPMSGSPADGLIQGNQRQSRGVLARADGPAHDPTRVRVGDERHIGERA